MGTSYQIPNSEVLSDFISQYKLNIGIKECHWSEFSSRVLLILSLDPVDISQVNKTVLGIKNDQRIDISPQVDELTSKQTETFTVNMPELDIKVGDTVELLYTPTSIWTLTILEHNWNKIDISDYESM